MGRAPGVGRGRSKGFKQAAAGAYYMRVIEMFAEMFEPVRSGEHVGVNCSDQFEAGVGKSGIPGSRETSIFLVANHLYWKSRGYLNAVVGGAIVDDQNFIGRPGLIQQSGKRAFEVRSSVVARDVNEHLHFALPPFYLPH